MFSSEDGWGDFPGEGPLPGSGRKGTLQWGEQIHAPLKAVLEPSGRTVTTANIEITGIRSRVTRPSFLLRAGSAVAMAFTSAAISHARLGHRRPQARGRPICGPARAGPPPSTGSTTSSPPALSPPHWRPFLGALFLSGSVGGTLLDGIHSRCDPFALLRFGPNLLIAGTRRHAQAWA